MTRLPFGRALPQPSCLSARPVSSALLAINMPWDQHQLPPAEPGLLPQVSLRTQHASGPVIPDAAYSVPVLIASSGIALRFRQLNITYGPQICGQTFLPPIAWCTDPAIPATPGLPESPRAGWARRSPLYGYAYRLPDLSISSKDRAGHAKTLRTHRPSVETHATPASAHICCIKCALREHFREVASPHVISLATTSRSICRIDHRSART